MQLSETVKLYMTREQKSLITVAMTEYISTVNSLVSDATNGISIAKYTTANVKSNLPSAITNQCIRDAKSIVRKYNKVCRDADRKTAKFAKQGKDIKVVATIPVLRKPCCYVNNQNYKVNGNHIEFPVRINGKSKRLSIKAKMTNHQKSIFASNKLGTMRFVYKNNKIVAQIVYETVEPTYKDDGNVMGVDLGIKCPAVSYTSDGNVKFYGNGRKNKYMRRHYANLRKKLQKAKHIDAVKRIKDKEHRIMRDTDHKISHGIVKTAVAHDVKVIKLEQLANIRSTTRTSRKNNNISFNFSIASLFFVFFII